MAGNLDFEEIAREQFPSKTDENGDNEAFVASEMSGGMLKKPLLFINRTDKKKGLVVNSKKDIDALIRLLQKLPQKDE